MRFIYNNQVYVLDNPNKQFKVYDLSVNTFDNDVPFTTLSYKKCTDALKKFVNINKVYLYGDLFKSNQIKLLSPKQTSLQLFVQRDSEDFVDGQQFYIQRKIDGFHSYIYLLEKSIPFDVLTTSVDETNLDQENLFECEYLNGKYYIFTIIREKAESRLDMDILDNFKLCQQYVKQSISIDFKITGQDKKSNVLTVGYIDVKKKTINEWVDYFKHILEAKTSSTILTDGFVCYKANKAVKDRCMYKVKPSDNTSCEFLLKWDASRQQYNIITLGGFRDFRISNSTHYVKTSSDDKDTKKFGYEFEFRLPFYLNTMSHVYKPKLDDPLGKDALNGELDEKICECAWHKYNNNDPYPSRVVPQKIRCEVSNISFIQTAINCYVGSLLSFQNATKKDIEDIQIKAPENYLDLYAGNDIQNQKSKPTMLVYQGSSKNFLAGLKDMTKFRNVYILQDSMALQINTLLYIRQQVLQPNTKQQAQQNEPAEQDTQDTQDTQDKKDTQEKQNKQDKKDTQEKQNKQDKQGKQNKQEKKQQFAIFPNWFMFKRNKLQQIIAQRSPFDVLRIEDSFDDVLNNIENIDMFNVISHSAKVVQIVDTKNVIKGSQFEKYISENYKFDKTIISSDREIKQYTLLNKKSSKK